MYKLVIFLISIFLFSALIYMVGGIWFRGKRSTYLNLFFAMGILYSFWALFNGFNLLLTEETYQQVYPLLMILACILPHVLMLYILYFTESRFAKSRAVTRLLIIMPALDILMLLTNPWHHEFIAGYNGIHPIGGRLASVHMVISYVPVFFSIFFLTRYIIKNIRKTPSLAFIGFGFFLPLVLNILYTFSVFDFGFDITPFAFIIMFSIFTVYSIRLRLFNIKETIVTSLFTSMSDAILVVNNTGVVAEANPALTNAFPNLELEVDKTAIDDVALFLESITSVKSPDDVFSAFRLPMKEISGAEITVSDNGETRNYTLSKDIIIERGQYAGFIITLSDVSSYRRMINEINEQNVKLTELKNVAELASSAKSNFLSRMSHEMRTPMNAIIGMTKIAEGTDDLSRLKHCLDTIGTSSGQLLSIINDVLDMSKIDAGKFELEYVPMNIEKMLMKICNLVIDGMEKKNQKFNVILGRGLCLNYIGDELRLSQVLTNILSNAMKFTPENGKITLKVDETRRDENMITLRFSVTDTGIGMTAEQISRMFNSFEQADGTITRRFGGTGLGLAISKSIVEKMGGHIDIESEYGRGSTFSFEVNLERSSHQDTVIFDGIRPADIKLLIVESDADIRKHFLAIIESFGMAADEAANAEEAVRLAETAYNTNRTYDIIFLDYDMPGINGLDIAEQLNDKINKNTVIIITSFMDWRRIEKAAHQISIDRYIAKPLFPSTILDAINDVIGKTLKTLEIKTDTPKAAPDFSGITILLAEDVDINREIFIALLDETGVSVDTAENGVVAVSKFKENPKGYDLIIMDIQMPEMDGYEATRTIRAMDVPEAKSVPIIAMTANAFKEDIDLCLSCGMNDHLSKPIDEEITVEKIRRYTGR